ncbi:MAG: hypothetical protein ABIG35_01210 [Pseudomonadota bacterium]
MKDMKRAIRRHHYARLKKARRWYHSQDQWQHEKWIGMAVATPQLCSNVCCGNQRAYYGRSLDELRGLDLMRDQESELK